MGSLIILLCLCVCTGIVYHEVSKYYKPGWRQHVLHLRWNVKLWLTHEEIGDATSEMIEAISSIDEGLNQLLTPHDMGAYPDRLDFYRKYLDNLHEDLLDTCKLRRREFEKNIVTLTDATTGKTSSWDVSQIKSMTNMFKHATTFNQPLGSWKPNDIIDGLQAHANSLRDHLDFRLNDLGSVTEMPNAADYSPGTCIMIAEGQVINRYVVSVDRDNQKHWLKINYNPLTINFEYINDTDNINYPDGTYAVLHDPYDPRHEMVFMIKNNAAYLVRENEDMFSGYNRKEFIALYGETRSFG